MTRDTMNRYLTAILKTLDEVTFATETYLALPIGIENWPTIRGILLAGRLATIDNCQVRLTQDGQDMLSRIRAFECGA